jgi:3-phenylpropionate/trans-cinnamate dioxygenase ferredoxin reductase component
MTLSESASSTPVLVVGASLAGLRCAEAVRKAGYTGELVVVGSEPHMPYNRPPLTKEQLGEVISPEWLRPNRAAADVVWRLGQTAAAADLATRTVRLASGELIGWRGLVVATGLRPRHLDLAGPVTGRHVIRSFENANKVRFATAGARSLVIIGAGFIGCEVAALAAKSGISTHVVAPEAVPIERPLGKLLGSEIRRRLELLGIQFHLGTIPVQFCGDDRVRSVILADSTELAADVVLEAVGSVPNVEWLSDNGFDLSDGVLCDANLRVGGRADVVACGDVARFPNLRFDAVPRRVEHWMMAIDTAKRAGQVLARHLTGADVPEDTFAPVPSFWSDQDSTRIQSFGSPDLGAEDVRILEGELDDDVAVGYHREGELVGVVLLGMQGRYMHYRRAVESVSADVRSGDADGA